MFDHRWDFFCQRFHAQFFHHQQRMRMNLKDRISTSTAALDGLYI
jgi:hypothetical protein